MYRIVKKEALKPTVVLYEIEAPMVARKAEPGQFIILRVDKNGERIPITIHDYDREKGTVTIICPDRRRHHRKAQPQAGGRFPAGFRRPARQAHRNRGQEEGLRRRRRRGLRHRLPRRRRSSTTAARRCTRSSASSSKDVVILEDEFKAVSTTVLKVCTDDGSYGQKGLVTEALKQLLDEGNQYDEVFAIGPMVMMKFVCKTSPRPTACPRPSSMNPIMIDGTGMCGGCRLTVGGETKFACVDGPDFDGQQVDWDQADASATRCTATLSCASTRKSAICSSRR